MIKNEVEIIEGVYTYNLITPDICNNASSAEIVRILKYHPDINNSIVRYVSGPQKREVTIYAI
jgi:hypothetical protein